MAEKEYCPNCGVVHRTWPYHCIVQNLDRRTGRVHKFMREYLKESGLKQPPNELAKWSDIIMGKDH